MYFKLIKAKTTEQYSTRDDLKTYSSSPNPSRGSPLVYSTEHDFSIKSSTSSFDSTSFRSSTLK